MGMSVTTYNWSAHQAGRMGIYNDEEGNEVEFSDVRRSLLSGTTVDAYMVNAANSGLSTSQLVSVVNGAQGILGQNGIGDNITYQFLTDMEVVNLPQVFNHRDRSLFLAFTNNQFSSIGSSDINRYTGQLSTWFKFNGKLRYSTGVNVSQVVANYSRSVDRSFDRNSATALSWIVAHEIAHQLDAFARMHSNGNLEGRPHSGHYNGENLLMDGKNYSNSATGNGQNMLPTTVLQRIAKYMNY